MKSGGFKKKKKSTLKKSKPRSKSKVEKIKRKARKKLNPGSAPDINKSLLLDDIARLGISSINKCKIISSIAKRLKI